MLLLAALLAPLPAQAATPQPSPSACPSPTSSPTPGATPTPQSAEQALCDRQATLKQVSAQLGQQLADGLAAERTLQQSLDDNARQQAELQNRIAAAQARAAELQAEVARLDQSIAALEVRIHRNSQELDRIVRAVYFTPSSLVVRLLQAGSLRTMLTQTAETAALAERARTLQIQLKSDRAELVQERARQHAALDEQLALAQRLIGDAAALQALRAQQEETARQLGAKIAGVKAELAQVNSQSAALAQQIGAELTREQQALIAKAVEQAWAQLRIWEQSNGVTGGPAPGALARPLPGAVVTQPFGPSDLWMEPSYLGFPHFHTGLDLAAPENTPVLAAAPGTVAVAESSQVGYGNHVIIAHAGGVATLYGHLNQALVKVGDHVVAGQPIGLEGSTGNSTGPHLHFEVRVNGNPVDPAPFFS